MNNKGFTLIEIVVTAVIVGMLGVMGLPSMLKMMNRSYSQDALHNLIAIYAAEQNYAQNNSGVFLDCNFTCINTADTGLGLGIASNGGLDYSCDATAKTCTATAAAGSQAGTFVMKVSLNSIHPINVTAAPVYCNNLTTPNYTVHNPCCISGGGTANSNCP
jgi:prepilin-type N-terminal cleavage/methylation domain-containing protein